MTKVRNIQIILMFSIGIYNSGSSACSNVEPAMDRYEILRNRVSEDPRLKDIIDAFDAIDAQGSKTSEEQRLEKHDILKKCHLSCCEIQEEMKTLIELKHVIQGGQMRQVIGSELDGFAALKFKVHGNDSDSLSETKAHGDASDSLSEIFVMEIDKVDSVSGLSVHRLLVGSFQKVAPIDLEGWNMDYDESERLSEQSLEDEVDLVSDLSMPRLLWSRTEEPVQMDPEGWQKMEEEKRRAFIKCKVEFEEAQAKREEAKTKSEEAQATLEEAQVQISFEIAAEISKHSSEASERVVGIANKQLALASEYSAAENEYKEAQKRYSQAMNKHVKAADEYGQLLWSRTQWQELVKGGLDTCKAAVLATKEKLVMYQINLEKAQAKLEEVKAKNEEIKAKNEAVQAKTKTIKANFGKVRAKNADKRVQAAHRLAIASTELKTIEAEFGKVLLSLEEAKDKYDKIYQEAAKIEAKLSEEPECATRDKEQQMQASEEKKAFEKICYEAIIIKEECLKVKRKYDDIMYNRIRLEQSYKIAVSNYKIAENEYKAPENEYNAVQNEYKAVQNEYKAVQNEYKAVQNEYKAVQREHRAVENAYKAAEVKHKKAEAGLKKAEVFYCQAVDGQFRLPQPDAKSYTGETNSDKSENPS